ncbi:hypothetical protein MMC13_008300 [Lambiella insularis]|nr:hypothetical protein [Lambiella insularis]
MENLRTKLASGVKFPVTPTASNPYDASSTLPSYRFTTPNRRSVHRWTVEEHAVLCVLERWFELGLPVGRKRRDVFNAYFVKSATGYDATYDVSTNAISAQLWEIRNDGKENLAWREVCLETDFLDSHNHWSTTRQDLMLAAAEIGIQLIKKTNEDRSQLLQSSGTRASKDKAKRKTVWQDKGDWDSITEFEDSETGKAHGVPSRVPIESGLRTPVSTSKRPRATKTCQRLVTSYQGRGTRSSEDDCVAEQHALPESPIPTPLPDIKSQIPHRVNPASTGGRLFFRFYDTNSQGQNSPEGFTAGAFTGLGLVTHPRSQPELLSLDYLTPAQIHLTRTEIATPFVSVWHSLLPALHRGLRSSAGPCISIIDLPVDSKQQNRYPRAVPVGAVVKELKNRGMYELNYTGGSEWLVWGGIEEQEVIATFSMEAFRDLVRSYPDWDLERVFRLDGIENSQRYHAYRAHLEATSIPLTRGVGEAVGFLAGWIGLPEAKLELLARSIAYVWRFEAATDPQRQQAYMTGVHYGAKIFRETAPKDEFGKRRAEIQRTLRQCLKASSKTESDKRL